MKIVFKNIKNLIKPIYFFSPSKTTTTTDIDQHNTSKKTQPSMSATTEPTPEPTPSPTHTLEFEDEDEPFEYNQMSATDFKESDGWTDSNALIDFYKAWGIDLPVGFVDSFPAVAFHGFLTDAEVERIDNELKSKEFEEKATAAWTDWRDADSDDWSEIIGRDPKEYQDLGMNRIQRGKKETKFHLRIDSPVIAEFVFQMVAEKKRELIAAKIAELQPKKKSIQNKVGSKKIKKADDEYEITFTNSEDKPQGEDYDYYLETESKCDSEATTIKDGKITKVADGKDKKSRTYKAVRKQTAFIHEGKCCGGITWDRAAGSEVLTDLGIKGSFVMGCGEDKEVGSNFCKKCKSKSNCINIYTDTYKSKDVKGQTYAQVLSTLGQSAHDWNAQGIREEVEELGGVWK